MSHLRALGNWVGAAVARFADRRRIRVRRAALRLAVHRSLDSAFENGYFQPGEQLHRAEAEDIAADLIAYAPDCEDAVQEELIAHVQEWLREKGMNL